MHIESLEDRRLLSVTVTEGYPGFYEVYGDASDDVITIDVSQVNETFTLDGTTYTSAAYIMIHSFGGDDVISVTASDGPGSVGASISSGDGNDSVTLNFGGAMWGGNGNDTLSITDAFYGEIHGESGDDVMYVSGATVTPIVRGGDGNDLIDATGNLAPLRIDGNDGNDTIYGSEHGDEIHGGAGQDLIFGNGGDDVFYTRNQDHDEIYGGDGTDIAHIDTNGDDVYDVEYIYRA
jgi:Ca2+-binding RTX toxin-like protein